MSNASKGRKHTKEAKERIRLGVLKWREQQEVLPETKRKTINNQYTAKK